MKNKLKNGKFIISVFVLIIYILFGACNPQKRINRILNRNPNLKRVTIYTINDTTFIKAFTFDTIYNYKNSIDTVFLKRETVIVKVFHHNDSIFVKALIKPDTIVKTISVPIKQIVYTNDDKKRWLFFWIGCASILFIIVIIIMVLNWIKS